MEAGDFIHSFTHPFEFAGTSCTDTSVNKRDIKIMSPTKEHLPVIKRKRQQTDEQMRHNKHSEENRIRKCESSE